MFDLGAILGSWFRGNRNRFENGPAGSEQVFNPFDIPTPLINDMISRNVVPWKVQRISLATAGSMAITTPGFHFVIYGTDNASVEMVNTQAIVYVWWGQKKSGVDPFPAKHARGLSGPFEQLYIEWPAQSGVYADLVVHTMMHTPWIDGEAAT